MHWEEKRSLSECPRVGGLWVISATDSPAGESSVGGVPASAPDAD